MAPKKGKKKGTKTVMSLADFNPDASVGIPQELRALPSAPKQADEWEAVGGRPEYNARGFKERTVTHDYDDTALLESDEAFMQRDWVRGGSMLPDAEGGAGQGDVERSWDGMRRGGPLDADEHVERDFGMARGGVGPVDSSFDAPGVEKDFRTARGGKGPIDASFDSGSRGGEVDFGAARGNASFEAEFAGGSAGDVDFGDARRGSAPFDASFEGGRGEVDFSKRSGPIEAEEPVVRNVDFAAARGDASFDAKFAGEEKVVDFGKRVGPVEAEFTRPVNNVDLGAAREKAAFNDEVSDGPVRDMSNMRLSAGAMSTNNRSRDGSDLDFGGARKSGMLGRLSNTSSGRMARGEADSRGPHNLRPGHTESNGKAGGREGGADRDWGRAREMKPLPIRAPMRDGGDSNAGSVANRGNSKAASVAERGNWQSEGAAKFNSSNDIIDNDGDWTTVRSTARQIRERNVSGQFRNSRSGSAPSGNVTERATFHNRAVAPASNLASQRETPANGGT